ncbi:MAG: CpsD/CapB family tyrosine-protein kinase [Thermoguttaceae bacterium]|jgi:tyrosine-protein kinase Etk/Wzc
MVQELQTPSCPRAASPAGTRRHKLSAHYRALAWRILRMGNGSDLGQAIGITGCARGAGASTVAINVAVSAARAGIGSVLLVDAAAGQRSCAHELGAEPTLGLADVSAGWADPLECVAGCRVGNLSIVTTGSDKQRFDPGNFAEVLKVYQHRFKLVVLDLPEATETTPCFTLAGQLDGVILVLEAERANGHAALRTKQQLEDAGARLVGVVLNKRPRYVPGWIYRRL